MKISEDEIQTIASLAKLDLNKIDIASLGQDLNNILSFVEQMDAVDTTDVDPLASPVAKEISLRADTPSEVTNREEFQAIAPAVENGLYLVPKVID
jgi:aspartyl-tRNA(Asn)/glutamyl-tRNA(Gln) amidotransferase subunit C